MKFVTVIFLMILVFFGITFSFQNAYPVSLKYYDLFDLQVPAYLIILIALFAGIIISGFVGLVERFKLSRKLSRMKKEIKALEEEIYDIRRAQIHSEGGPAIKKEYLS